MNVNRNDFVTFEEQFSELISEFQLITLSEIQLRESLRNEARRAEAAEAAKDEAERSASDAQSYSAGAASFTEQATKALAAANDELVNVKIQLEFTERQRTLFEEKCAEMSIKINSLEKEIQQLRSLQSAHSTLQRQYADLQERTKKATEEARNETSRLETELRRVEKCANAGKELRERARLAAAAHARERRFAAAEQKHIEQELKTAKTELARQTLEISELQRNLSKQNEKSVSNGYSEEETLKEVRAILEAERAGAARLEQALASAVAENTALLAQLRVIDNATEEKSHSHTSIEHKSNISPIDIFLAD